MGKVERNVAVDAEILADAEAKGVAIEAALEEGLRAALSRVDPERPIGIVAAAEYQRRHPAEAAARAKQWAEENAEAIELYRKRIEDRGLFGDDLRRW